MRKLAADLQSGDLARVTGAIKAPKGVVLNADFVARMHNAKITVKPDSVSSKGTAGQVIYIVTPDLAGKTHEWATTMEYTKMYHPRVRGALKARWDEVHEVEAVGATADTVRLLDLDARAAGTHQLGVHGEVGGGETGPATPSASVTDTTRGSRRLFPGVARSTSPAPWAAPVAAVPFALTTSSAMIASGVA